MSNQNTSRYRALRPALGIGLLCGLALILFAANKKSKSETINFDKYLLPAADIQGDNDTSEEETNLRRRLIDINSVSIENPEAPRVAWLMSFPNSGTTYTMMLTQQVTETTTANVYGSMLFLKDGQILRNEESSVPVFTEKNRGPFLFSDYDIPNKYILTKTHCAGYCYDCLPKQYIHEFGQFYKGCVSGSRVTVKGGEVTNEIVAHDQSLVKKAVHIIRNPLDNVAARFHFVWKRGDTGLNFDTEGYHEWCSYLDDKYKEDYKSAYSQPLWELAQKVPCHAEFYKYVQWHNFSFEVTGKNTLNIPVLIIDYEHFHSHLESTIKRLLDFLELPNKHSPPEFIFNRHRFFSEEETKNIYLFLRSLATEQTWEYLEPYCEDEKDKFDLCGFMSSMKK